MGKGHYHGGGTLIGPKGRIGRAPSRGGSGCKAAAEARRVARKKKKAEQKKRIAKNERLIQKLPKLWQEERGMELFQHLSKRAEQRRQRSIDSEQTESALAQALKAAGLIPDQTRGDEA